MAQLNRFPMAGQRESGVPMPIDYPFDELPAAGVARPVATGVFWLRMPLPFALDHINLWLLEDGDAWTAVDTGIAIEPIKDAWKSVMATRRLARQIVTHFHPDHLGLAAWLQEQTDAPLWITQGEYLTGTMVRNQWGSYGVDAMVDFFRANGLDAARLQALKDRGNAYGRGVPAIPATFQPIWEGMQIDIGGRVWRVMIGRGHAPEHASLYCDELRVLISGDMLLPRISSNISAFASAPDWDPLGAFLDSIDAFRALPEDTLVLPSHGLPFRGMHARVDQLYDHHGRQCEKLLAACSAPMTAADLMPVMFARELADPHQTMFAMGEAIAHLHHLHQTRHLERATENGIIRYVKN
jgi:glyoxylase-like metal-dependent hydrolase (beta-lactamase superfamily II)